MMMARKWKPGDVVTATVNGRENVRLVAGWSKYDPQLRWCELSPRRGDGDDEKCWFFPSQVTDARPLVVIDPEDREQMRRIAECAADGDAAEWRVDMWQRYFRSLANPTPPKPDEPTGLGAVVEATCGCDGEPQPFVRNEHVDPNDPWEALCGWHIYADLNAVRVLSEGVQS